MSVATSGKAVTHQLSSADKVGQDMRHNNLLGTCLRTGVGSGRSPVSGNVAPELYAPEIEQATHEVGLAQQLVTSLLLTRPVESINSIDDSVSTGNTYIGIVPGIIKKIFLVGHQVTDSMTLNVTSTTGTVCIVRHDIANEPRGLQRSCAELVHHTIQGSQLLVQVIS